MGLGRRSFLKAFGAVPLAPLSAKDVLASSGMSSLGLGSVIEPPHVSPHGPPPSKVCAETESANWILSHGIPDFVLEAMKQRGPKPTGLDPDLAANRSFSLDAKVRMQRDRNFHRRCREFKDNQRSKLASAAFRKATGFSFWW